MPDEDVNVSVADDHLGRFDEAVQRMEQAGLKVQQTLPAIGIVSGAIDASKIDNLEKLPEVSGVERSRTVRIPPPDSDVV
jgi:hypothetical protein